MDPSSPFRSVEFILVVCLLIGLAVALAAWRFKPSLTRYMHTGVGPVPTILFVVVFFSYFAWETAHKPRVMILHSYATDFSWVNDLNIGLEWELSKKAYSLRYHYMDTKRHSDKEFMERAGQQAQRLIREWVPDVLIAVDDNAQQLAARRFINHPDIRIVYTGVNADPAKYGYDDSARNVTGLLERIPFDALKEFVMTVTDCAETEGESGPATQGRCRLIHYSDDSNTSIAVHAEMENFDWSPIQIVEHTMVASFEEWQEKIRNLDDRADFLFITHYHTLDRDAGCGEAGPQTDKDCSNVPPPEVMRWTTANTPIPDIGTFGFYVQDGGMVALGPSPYEMGQVAARDAIRIIETGTLPPVQTSEYYTVYVRQQRLLKFGIELPRIYEAFAHATNNYIVDEEPSGEPG